jgi:SAM-dependent methyltransferase
VYSNRSKRALDAWRARLASRVTGDGHGTALEMLDLYYRQGPAASAEGYNYFGFRFTQPRHLVALALLSVIENPVKPLLELGCGFGHLTRSLVQQAAGQAVIGIDQSFFALFVAKKWIAREASFVCYGMDGGLPFPDAAFSATVCVDGIHYIEAKTIAVREMTRTLIDDGMIILACSRNAAVPYPYAGFPLAVEGYGQLVTGMPQVLLADGDILEHYLKGFSPPLDRCTNAQQLAAAPLVSIVASRQKDALRDRGRFETPPHSHGRCGVNPLYSVERRADGGAVLRRTFPSSFYAEDNAEAASYLPAEASISRDGLSALDEGRRTPEIERLIEQYVVLGLPERYGAAHGAAAKA